MTGQLTHQLVLRPDRLSTQQIELTSSSCVPPRLGRKKGQSATTSGCPHDGHHVGSAWCEAWCHAWGIGACKASVVQWGVSWHTRGHWEEPRFKYPSACLQPVGTSDFVRPIFVPIGRPRNSHQLNRVRDRSRRSLMDITRPIMLRMSGRAAAIKT